MKRLLIALFSVIFVWMIVMTVRASLEQNLWTAGPAFSANPWAIATLWDAYFGFLTFYFWVAWRETNFGSRFLWFILIMCLGNIAMSGYMLIQLVRLGPADSMEALFRRRPA